MKAARSKVYCAGPLFNGKEREEMAEIAACLEAAGYDTFLPQRDGLELAKCIDALVEMGVSPDKAGALMAEAIFALDVYQVLQGCDAVVANLNGRVPDEGTVSEAAMAWSRGKVVVGYKADSRSAFNGQDNPLVTGLFGFRMSRSLPEVLDALKSARDPAEGRAAQVERRETEIQSHLELGHAIWGLLQEGRRIDDVADTIVKHKSRGAHSTYSG